MILATIEIVVSPDGSEAEVDGKHFKDSSCSKFHKVLKDRFIVQDEKKKDTYYKTTSAGVSIGA